MKVKYYARILKAMALIAMLSVVLSGCIASGLNGVEVRLAEGNYMLLPVERIYIRYNENFDSVVEAVYTKLENAEYIYEAVADPGKTIVGGYVTDGVRSWVPEYSTNRNVLTNMNIAGFNLDKTDEDWGRPDRAAAVVRVDDIRIDSGRSLVEVTVLDDAEHILQSGRPEVYMSSDSPDFRFYDGGNDAEGGFSTYASSGTAQFVVDVPSGFGASNALSDLRQYGVRFHSGQALLEVEYSDAYLVAMDKRNLQIGYASGDSGESVTRLLTLPTTGADGSGISWSSSNQALLRDNGTLAQLAIDEDTDVVLTATISRGSASDTKAFTVTVKKEFVPTQVRRPSTSEPERILCGTSGCEVGWDGGTVIKSDPMSNSSSYYLSAREEAAPATGRPAGSELIGQAFSLAVTHFGTSSPAVHIQAIVPEQLDPEQWEAKLFRYNADTATWEEVQGGEEGRYTLVAEEGQVLAVFAVPVSTEAEGEEGSEEAPESPQGPQSPETPEAPASFNDTAGHWADVAIARAAAAGIVAGFEDGSFRPAQSVNRAEFIAMLIRAVKPAESHGGNSQGVFADEGDIPLWAKDAVLAAYEAGLISGFEDQTFRSGQSISRAEMAVIMARALNVSGDAGQLSGLVDGQQIPVWARGAVAALLEQGVMTGTAASQFEPARAGSRAEAAVLLLRLLERQ